MTKRAVPFARVCVDAQECGWHVVEELAEQGASGNSLDRPQLNCMLEMARAGGFGVLVVHDPYRLGRDLAKLLAVGTCLASVAI